MKQVAILSAALLLAVVTPVMGHGTGHDESATTRPRPAQSQSAPPAAPANLPVVSLDAPQLGDRSADIVIVEFSDYQCPYCRKFHLEQLPKLKKRYVDTGVAQYVFKDFPLRQHREALPAAVFAHCAGEQGKFWEMQQQLFREQARLGDALFAELTKRLALDETRISACRADPVMRVPIEQFVAEGARLAIDTTPTILLGRRQGDTAVVLRMAPGLPDFDALVQEIESLKKNAGRPLAEQATRPGN